MPEPPKKDLVVLVADKDMEFALRGILSRHASLKVRELRYEIYSHPEHDPGCRLTSHEFLATFVNQFLRALVILDMEGSGACGQSREELEMSICERLYQAGWAERAAVVAIEPELEAWVWSDSPEVDEALGWRKAGRNLRAELRAKGFLETGNPKPCRPKEAAEWALREVRRPRSSAIYRNLAGAVSLDRCTDPSFAKFKAILREWFPVEPGG